MCVSSVCFLRNKKNSRKSNVFLFNLTVCEKEKKSFTHAWSDCIYNICQHFISFSFWQKKVIFFHDRNLCIFKGPRKFLAGRMTRSNSVSVIVGPKVIHKLQISGLCYMLTIKPFIRTIYRCSDILLA